MTSPTSNPSRSFGLDAFNPADAARAWACGWAISRGTPAPVEGPGYFRILVGKPDQVTRYVLPRLDHEVLRKLVSIDVAPGTWLKVCAAPEDVARLLSSDWTVHAPEFLMVATLAGKTDATGVAGYRVQAERAGAIVSVRLVTESGDVAASGQAAVDGAFAAFDQIVTSEAHRRKGLGRCVMAALSEAAIGLGATHGVLVATEAGAALYTALGWSVVSPVTAASNSAGAPAA